MKIKLIKSIITLSLLTVALTGCGNQKQEPIVSSEPVIAEASTSIETETVVENKATPAPTDNIEEPKATISPTAESEESTTTIESEKATATIEAETPKTTEAPKINNNTGRDPVFEQIKAEVAMLAEGNSNNKNHTEGNSNNNSSTGQTEKPSVAPTESTKPIETTQPTENTQPTATPTENTQPTQAPETTPSHSHSYSPSITKEATCTESGIKTYICSCGDTYTEPIASNGTHSYVWETSGDTRTMKCGGCGSTGITEYCYNGAWGYYDDNAANELWNYVNNQRNATITNVEDDWGNAIGVVNVASLNSNGDLTSKAKYRATEAAVNFSHAGQEHECLAWGQGSAQDAYESWCYSESHLRAMVDSAYTIGGIACFYYDSDGSGNNLTPIWVLELGY